MLSLWTRHRDRLAAAGRKLLALELADVLSFIVVVVALAALVQAALHRIFDYDEVEHAYAAWLISRGFKPFYDFFECHPPFLWYPHAWMYVLFGDSHGVLVLFRFIAALGQIVFLVGVVKNVALSLREMPAPLKLATHVAVLAIAFALADPANFDYPFEFRIDAWPNAVLVLAIYRYRSRRSGAFRSSVELAALAAAAVLCSPKLIVFIGLFVVATVIIDDRRGARVLGMLAGGAGALAVGATLLLLAGLNPIAVYRTSLLYHHVLNSDGGFEHGLYGVVVGEMTTGWYVMIAAVVAWALVSWRRMHRSPFEIAVFLFLVLQMVIVGFPYKQYIAPWFMLGVAFLPYLEVLARRSKLLHSTLLAVAFLYTANSMFQNYGHYRAAHDQADDFAARDQLAALVPRGGYVAAMMEQMPYFRRNSFYQVVNSLAGRGLDGTQVMQRLAIEPFSKNFTEESALRQLEAHPPDVIVLNASYPAYARRALDSYVARYGGAYYQRQVAYWSVLIRRR